MSIAGIHTTPLWYQQTFIICFTEISLINRHMDCSTGYSTGKFTLQWTGNSVCMTNISLVTCKGSDNNTSPAVIFSLGYQRYNGSGNDNSLSIYVNKNINHYPGIETTAHTLNMQQLQWTASSNHSLNNLPLCFVNWYKCDCDFKIRNRVLKRF